MPVLRLDLRCLKEVAIYHGQVILEDTLIERERIESGLTRQLMKVYMSLEFSLLLKLKHQGCKKEDLRGDDLKHYEVEIEAMDLIFISIPNDIYNSVDACKTVKSMWQRNDIIFPNVTVNIKFLNCLQPEWLKYVTRVRLAKRLTEDSYDDLFDYLQQFEKLKNASRAKKVEKSHDPLALVAHTGLSSRTTTPYYVIHPPLVVDYDDDYQGDVVQNNYEEPLTCAIILLARAITQRFSNPTNNHLRTSSNTKNQAIVQGDRDEAGVTLTDEQNNFLFADNSRMEEIEELSAKYMA
ncbi:hypothetical protein Tco_1361361 [Tanacetum coccineum]